MATIRILLGIICLVSTLCNCLPSGNFLGFEKESDLLEILTKVSNRNNSEHLKGWHCALVVGDADLCYRHPLIQHIFRTKGISSLQNGHQKLLTELLYTARSQIGVREATGRNDGAAVESYLHYTGNKKGAPWCASFVSWVFGQTGLKQPRSAWSPALFPKEKIKKKPKLADVFGIYFAHLKRIGHCGMVEEVKGNWVITIEGNTNNSGAREGEGVFRKWRHDKTIHVYADWVNSTEKGASR